MIKRLSKMGLIVLVTLLSLALVVLPACSAPAAEEEEEEEEVQVITIKAATYFGSTSDQAKMLDAFCNALQTESDGRLSITRYWAGTLAGGPQLYGAAADGSIDIIFTMLGYTGGIFPVTCGAFAQPTGVPSAWVGTHVANDFYQTYKPGEFNSTHPLFFSASAPLVMYTKTAVRTKADLAGKIIRAGAPNNPILTALGASTSSLAQAEVYEAISKGQIDGCMIGCDGFSSWKLQDVAKYTTFPYVAGCDIFITTMSNKCWNSLPADLQAVVTSVSASFVGQACTYWTNANKSGMDIGQAAGVEFITLNASQRALWQASLAGVIPTWVTGMVGKGFVQSDVEGWLTYIQGRLEYWVGEQIKAGVPFLAGYPPS
jgi:TRAP-type C4-dicarboxylate transport system substrate-binding protein